MSRRGTRPTSSTGIPAQPGRDRRVGSGDTGGTGSSAAGGTGSTGAAGGGDSAGGARGSRGTRRTWTPAGPYDLVSSLRVLRRGPYDPACRITDDGTVWRATRTPDGPATLRIAADRTGGVVEAEGWGPGGDWALDRLPALLGADDDPDAFVPHHQLLHQAHRRNPGLRLSRTGRVLEALIPTILEQKVTSEEAYRAWGRLLRRFGTPAPGPPSERSHTQPSRPGRPSQPGQQLYVMPEPRAWCLIPSWEWHRAGVDSKRSSAILRAAQRAARMEEAATMKLEAAMARLRAIPGIGPWTAAETLQRSNGEPDAITVGDLHLPRIVGYALTGRRDVDDDGMLELLAPYGEEGQRHRAARLVLTTGRVPPRRTPRMPYNDIARW